MKYAISILLILALTISHAQDKLKKIEFGFGGGVNCSFASISKQPGARIALPGFNAGLIAEYRISTRFFATSKILYSEQGTKYKGDNNMGHLEVKYNYSWMATYFQLNYVLTSRRSNKFFVGLGLSPQKLLSSGVHYSLQPYWAQGIISSSNSNNDQFNQWNFCSSSQTGVQMPLRQGGKILIAISFERSLSNLLKRTPTSTTFFDYAYAPSDIRINSFSLGVTYVY